MTSPDVIDVAVLVTSLLEELGVPSLVGGSVGSMLFGEPRYTRDVDLVADLEPRHVEPLLAALGSRFYADRDMMLAAIREHRSFNLIHLETMIKVDVFVPPREGLHAEKWARRRRVALRGRDVFVTDPESLVIQKLVWFRDGGGVSNQQWNDVVGLLAV